MMRKALVATMLVALLFTGVASGQSIQSLPGSGWWTSAGIQNVGTGTAALTLTAYPADATSTTTYSNNTTIAQGGSVTFLPGSTAPGTIDVGLPDSFVGSMVLSSDQPLVAIGQVGNNQLSNPPLGVTGGYASGMYRGASAGASTITFPTVKNNFGGKTSTFYVQATGADVTIVATVKTNDGTSHTYTPSGGIKANKHLLLSMENFTPAIANSNCGSANTSPCVGSLTVVAAGGQIAGVALETDSAKIPATRLQVASMFTPNDAATTVYCPVFKNNYGGRFTGVTVQNVSGGTVNIYATFSASAGAGTGTFHSSITGVADGSSQTFSAQVPNVGGFPDNTYGSMVITSTGNIIAAVNEANFSGVLKATTYTCFSASAATLNAAFPQVKEMFGVNTTGVSVQNIGSADTSINAVYTCGGTAYTHVAVSLAKGATYTYYKPSSSAANWSGTALPSNQNCAVKVTASQPIVGIGQEAATTSLDTKNYEAFSLP